MCKITKFIKLTYRNILKILPEKLALNVENIRGYRRVINFKSPRFFGEKIQFLKIYGNLEKYEKYADKYKVREYIEKKIGKEYLIPLIGVYDSAKDIDYDKLPNKFVIKANHGSGYNLIVKDKTKLDIKKTNKILTQWLKEDFSKIRKEYQYKNIKRKLICETFVTDKKNDLLDFKFFCFNGKVEFLKVDFDRYKKHKSNYYDRNKNRLQIREGKYPNYEGEFEFPNNFEDMIEVAEKLSKEFDFVRVDLYNADGKIYFGELTYTPSAGINALRPLDYDLKYANLINVDRIKKYNNVLYLGSMGIKSGRKDGVTIKSRCLHNFLMDKDIVLRTIDVDDYKHRWFSIIKDFAKYYNKANSIVICSSSPGAYKLLKFLSFINCKKEIYYFVAGGILDQWISKGKYNIKCYKNIKRIYVESCDMEKKLKELGLSQTMKVENFRNPEVYYDNPTVNTNIIKFVFFGRVIEKKGVEDAIHLVENLKKDGFNVSLDIYGQATSEYSEKIQSLISECNYINYHGAITPDNSTEYITLHEYDIFLFPTKFYEEGLPGALIDAYISGLAILSANWKYANEYIKNNINGKIFNFNDYDDMYEKAKEMINSGVIYRYKEESLKLSKNYIIKYLLDDFQKEITNNRGD